MTIALRPNHDQNIKEFSNPQGSFCTTIFSLCYKSEPAEEKIAHKLEKLYRIV